MKTPTHIYIFEKSLSAEQFELANKRTKNHDFEKLKIEDYPTLFSTFKIMCDEYWGGEYEHVYATYLVNDYTTLKLSNLNPSYILEYNEKLNVIFNETKNLYLIIDNLYEKVCNASAIINEYHEIKLENLEYKREIDTEYLSVVYEVISEEKGNILGALDNQLYDLNLA